MKYRLMIDNYPSKYYVGIDKLVAFDNDGNRVEFPSDAEHSVEWANMSSIEVFDEFDNIVRINHPANTITGLSLIQ